MKFIFFAILLMLSLPIGVSAQHMDTLRNGLALTPPMGWNAWNTFKKNPSEKLIREIADAVVEKGLKKAGYMYINVDDFWSKGRDSISGAIIVDTSKFPHGMKALADYIHSKGLKAGIYTNIGKKANYATLASGGYYDADMKTFADWGYDYVKVDVNFAPVRTEEAYKREFMAVAEAIKKSGRPMVFSICNQGGRNYWNWAPLAGNSWRVGPDIDHTPKQKTQWEGVLYELDLSAVHPQIAGPGHWNDADMMLIGVGDDGGRLVVMSDEEMRSHFSMWCMIASPLMLGNDLRNIPQNVLNIISNKEAIAINQDKLGVQGTMAYEQSPGLQVWVKKLKSKNSKEYAIALFNKTEYPAQITINFDRIGLTGTIKISDVWTHQKIGKFDKEYSYSVPKHGVKLLFIK
jgi:alpha-galactosidase